MLLTELQIGRRKTIIFDRFREVQISMAAIKHVSGERKRAAIAAHEELKMLEDLQRKGGGGGSSSSPIVQDDHDNDNNEDDSMLTNIHTFSLVALVMLTIPPCV